MNLLNIIVIPHQDHSLHSSWLPHQVWPTPQQPFYEEPSSHSELPLPSQLAASQNSSTVRIQEITEQQACLSCGILNEAVTPWLSFLRTLFESHKLERDHLSIPRNKLQNILPSMLLITESSEYDTIIIYSTFSL